MDNVALQAGLDWAAGPASARPKPRRGPQLPFYVILFAVSLLLTLATLGGIANYDLPVKLEITALVAAAALCAVYWKPAIFPIAVYFAAVPFDNVSQTGEGTITKLLAEASVIVVLLVLAASPQRSVTPPLPAVLAWMALVLWSIVSLTWTVDLPQSMIWVTQVGQLFLLYAIFSMFRIRESEVRILVWAIIAGGVACSLYGLYFYLTGRFMQSSGEAQLRLLIQFGQNGSMGSINSDHFAGALVLPIALSLVIALRSRGLQRVLAWAALLILFEGVFVSATRSAVIAFGLMWAYLMFVSPRSRKQLVTIAVAGIVASLAMPSVWLRFADPTQGGGNGRYAIWTVGWHAFRAHWMLGAGAGNFRAAYSDALLGLVWKGPPPPMIQDAHNMIVSTAVELGVLGLVLLGAAWYFQFRSLAIIPWTSSLADLRMAGEAGLIGLCFEALTLDVLFFKYLWIAFMIAVLIRNAYVCSEQSRPLRARALPV